MLPTAAFIDCDWVKATLGVMRSREPAVETFSGTLMHLIDCKTLEVVPSTTQAEYLALSYVIGSSPSGGPIMNGRYIINDRLPQTVRDAISFTLNIGKRYLWVDQYCLSVEKSSRHKTHLNAMAEVYASAHATIICLGPDQNAPLWGVSSARPCSYTCRTANTALCLSLPSISGQVINSSKYAERGWVLQGELPCSVCLSTKARFSSIIE